MNPTRTQDLSEAFNSIISMVLASLRVRGWRALGDLPKLVMAAILVRRLAREFTALLEAFRAGTLPLEAPAPAPAPLAPMAYSAAAPARLAVPANRAGRVRRPAASRPAAQPQSVAPPRRTRAPYVARRQAFAPLRRAHDPRDTVGMFVTSRSF